MAGYKTHISAGTAIAMLFTLASFVLHWIDDLLIGILVFFVTLAGSFLPDMDSDSGMPFKVIFYLYGLLGGAFTFYFLYITEGIDAYLLLTAPIIAFLMIRFVVGNVFRFVTHHRGMFHSVPAALASSAIAFFLTNFTAFPLRSKLVISAGIGIGYFCHLILDEIYSTNMLNGTFHAKRSLGTALKIKSKSKVSNVITYGILIVFLILSLISSTSLK